MLTEELVLTEEAASRSRTSRLHVLGEVDEEEEEELAAKVVFQRPLQSCKGMGLDSRPAAHDDWS